MMMNTVRPTVSVIIPTYNRQKFIGASIESVLAQTYKDYEIIIVDDGSTDATADVVLAYSSDKVRYVLRPNEGRSAARNQAMGMARGRYIAFLDSDDLYLPEKLAMQVAYMELHADVDMLYTSAYCIDENGRRLPYVYEASVSGWIYEQVAFYVPVTVTLPTVFVRREVFDTVGNFDTKMDRFEDTDMWRRIAKRFKIAAMPQRTCLLRTHSDNSLLEQDPLRIKRAIEYYVDKIFKEDRDLGSAILKRGASGLYLFYAKALLSQFSLRLGIKTGRELLFSSVSYAPMCAYRLGYLLYYPVRRFLRRLR